MPRYIASGRATLSGVVFVVEASSEDEARRKINNSEWDDVQYDGAELVDWAPALSSIKEDR